MDGDVVTITDDDSDGSRSNPVSSSSSVTSSSAVSSSKKTTLSAQAQNRMSILSAACKKYEFVPFTKEGHTVFVKFSINLDETRCNAGSVATFVIRLLAEGYWTLFVHGKKLQKNHRVYQRFSCENNLASSSKNYKLDIAKVDELFAYLNSCFFCVGNPEVFPLMRESNVGDGLTLIQLPGGGGEAVEVLRNVKWKEKIYPSTLVHKVCELIRSPEEMGTIVPQYGPEFDWFRCAHCDGIADSLAKMNSKTEMMGFVNKFRTSRGSQTDAESAFEPQEDYLTENSSQISQEFHHEPHDLLQPPLPPAQYLVAAPTPPQQRQASPAVHPQPLQLVVNNSNNHNNILNVDEETTAMMTTTSTTMASTMATAPAAITFLPPDPAGPTFLLAKNEDGRHYILQDSLGDYYCGICSPTPFLFTNQREKVSFNEHLWMKHHIFVDSISLWCQFCQKPFFDNSRFHSHVKRDHPESA